MEQKETLSVPAFVHEAEAFRADRKNKRLWVVVMALIGVIALIILGVEHGSDTGAQGN